MEQKKKSAMDLPPTSIQKTEISRKKLSVEDLEKYMAYEGWKNANIPGQTFYQMHPEFQDHAFPLMKHGQLRNEEAVIHQKLK